MAWVDGWDKLSSAEQERRVTVARALSRQDFWKAAYLASLEANHDDSFATTHANNALSAFDKKFGGAP